MAVVLRPLQERLGREINVTRYTRKEFAAKVAGRNHFLTSVLQKPRIFLIGGEDELEQVAGRPGVAPEPTSKQELDGIRQMVTTNLNDANVAGLSSQGRYEFAYNACAARGDGCDSCERIPRNF